MTQLSPHFTLEEFTFSETAARKGIDNSPTEGVICYLEKTAILLEKVRYLLGNKSIYVSSGYRSPRLNSLIGGAATSAHIEGRAVDFTCRDFGKPLQIAKALVNNEILKEVDQIIMEGNWIHLAIARYNSPSRQQILTATFINGKATYKNGL